MKQTLITLISLIATCTLHAQLVIQITQTPNNTPTNETLYLAGNITNWETADSNYAFAKTSNGIYELSLNINSSTIEFKITRGSWDSVEGDANGQYRPNRSYTYIGQPDTLSIDVLSWEDLGGNSGISTAAENVSILSNEFDLKTLGSKRKVWIYLPPDYEQSNQSYPVLYMQDGQNLFDATTSFSGEWQVDETLNELFDQGDPGIIVVGIDNGGASRIDEYTPWPNPQYGGGKAELYVKSIIQDLKPYVDDNYRTLSDQQHTGIMGSSLGGLVSLYGLIEHQEVFGKAGIFSPSYWFSSESYEHVISTPKTKSLQIYTIGGEQEGSDMAANIQRMDSVFTVSNFSPMEFKTIIHPDGAHTERYWGREFKAAYLWLFANNTSTPINNPSTLSQFSVYPNPAGDSISIKLSELPKRACLKIIDARGETRFKIKIKTPSKSINIGQLPSGSYHIQLYQGKKLIATQQFIKQ